MGYGEREEFDLQEQDARDLADREHRDTDDAHNDDPDADYCEHYRKHGNVDFCNLKVCECIYKGNLTQCKGKGVIKVGNDVVIKEKQLPTETPNAVMEAAIIASKKLQEIVSRKPKKVLINNEQYLEFEDWQTLGRFYGVCVKTGEAIPVEINGVKGAKAKAEVLNPMGEVVGGAEAYCLYDEPNWKGKPFFQLASMAQTRAGAKALRNVLAWIAVLAGYKPTPAEEMTGMERNNGKDKPQAQENGQSMGKINEKQTKLLYARWKNAGISDTDAKAYIKQTFNVEHTRELTSGQMDQMLKWIEGV